MSPIKGPVVRTVYVDDPWYDWNTNTPGKDPDGCPGSAGSGTYTCGKIGLAPNTAITYATWKAYYYTVWGHQDCPYWNGKFVAVLREASGVPTIATMPGAAKDPAFGPTPDPDPGVEYAGPQSGSGIVRASAPDIGSLDTAFINATREHGLDRRVDLAASLDGGQLSKVVRVESLVQNSSQTISSQPL